MELLLFRNVKHCSALVNLLLDRIPVPSVLRATVRTLKPKKPKKLKNTLKTKNLNLFLKSLRFLPALVETDNRQPINPLIKNICLSIDHHRHQFPIININNKLRPCVLIGSFDCSLRRQVNAINRLAAAGMSFWDYGNAFLLEAGRAG